MAIRINSTTQNFKRTTNLPGITSWTIMFWLKLVTDRNDFSTFFEYGNTTGLCYTYHTDASGTTTSVYNSFSEAAGSALTIGAWNHIAATVAGTGSNQFLAYLNGVLNITYNGSANPTSTQLTIGQNNSGGEPLDGTFAAVKIYSAALTANEILNEMYYFTPVRTANLNTWLPCVEPVMSDNAIDFSGIGGNMTVTGTPVVEDGPPIAWGPFDDLQGYMAYSVAGFPGVEGVPVFGSRIGKVVENLPSMIPTGIS